MWHKAPQMMRVGPCQLSKAKRTLPVNNVDLAAIQEELETINRALVSVLRGGRQDADITQAQIGHWLGISEDVVSNIEALKRPAFFAHAVVWARLSGMDCEEFFESFLFWYRKMRSRKS
nr:hypothetical protein Hi04_10k_c4921_00011 [uncultured bacterium]